MKPVLPLAAAAAASIAHPATAEPANPTALSRSIDQAIDRAIAEQRIVGTVVIVMQDGKVVYTRAAGDADREEHRAMRPDAIFRLASVSKPYVTAAVMRLVEQGKMTLDDPVTRWLPDFTPRLPDGTAPVIRIRDLLAHRAGLSYTFEERPDGPYHKLHVLDGMEHEGGTLAQNLARLKQAPLVFKPGTAWRYSLGTDVVGAVIEKVTGTSLPDAVDALVLRPLGLHDTGFVARDAARLAVPYASSAPMPVRMWDGISVPQGQSAIVFAPSRATDPKAYPSGGAGMVGTAGDFATFIDTMRRGGGTLLKPATVAAMMHDEAGPSAMSQGPGWGFGYGFAVLDDPAPTHSPQSPGTIQWGGAYGHNWFVDPARKLTVVAMTNTTFEGMAGRFPVELRDAVYAALGKGDAR